jgi:hypothetical protein
MSFALFTLSPMEIMILGGTCMVPVVLGIIWLVVLRPAAAGRYSLPDRDATRVEEEQRLRIMDLEAENQQLRDEVERLRRGQSPETFTP